MNTPTTGASPTPRTAEAASVIHFLGKRLTEGNLTYYQFCDRVSGQLDGLGNLERELTEARAQVEEAKKKQSINTHRRLFDLVRNCRAQLHEEDLITDDEYAWLCGHEFKEDKGKPGSPSPRRLEDYDQLRAQLAALEADKGKLREAVMEAKVHIEHLEHLRTHDCGPTPATLTVNVIATLDAALTPNTKKE